MSSGAAGSRDGRNARRNRRVAVDLPATLGGRVPRPAQVLDLSRLGCLVRSEVRLDEGVVVDLAVQLPDGALRTKARVAGSSVDGDSLPGPPERYLAGLEFLSLPAGDEVRLRTFLEAEEKRRRGAHTPPS